MIESGAAPGLAPRVKATKSGAEWASLAIWARPSADAFEVTRDALGRLGALQFAARRLDAVLVSARDGSDPAVCELAVRRAFAA